MRMSRHPSSTTREAARGVDPVSARAGALAGTRVRIAATLALLALLLTVPLSAASADGETPSPTPSAPASATPEPTPTATPEPTPTPTPTVTPPTTPPVKPIRRVLPLRVGDYGPLIATAQKRLMWMGYEIAAVNVKSKGYGESTASAVKDFQRKFWLPVTGKIDQKTWRTLSHMAEPVAILPLHCTESHTAICVDKTARLVRYVVGGKVKMTADARFGRAGLETGEGVYSVTRKSYDHVSTLFRTWMPRAMFFNRGQAVHYSPDFAANGYNGGSHGCIGMRDMEKATWLFNQVGIGTRVYVYWS
jgi:hypothetical protein